MSATVGDLLSSRIHKAYTEVADDLLATGVLTQEERIDLSTCITKSLNAFRKELIKKCPKVNDRKVKPDEVSLVLSIETEIDSSNEVMRLLSKNANSRI